VLRLGIGLDLCLVVGLGLVLGLWLENDSAWVRARARDAFRIRSRVR
jgi:hypothetical protein